MYSVSLRRQRSQRLSPGEEPRDSQVRRGLKGGRGGVEEPGGTEIRASGGAELREERVLEVDT